ncbi:TRAP transporter large permease [Microbaculum marinum]|uniref:TRAP transporter large permease protein n=1 Tax=Microbaculum marinum TaxID=1764581 RepID=A0AAW9RQ54_9HYPH
MMLAFLGIVLFGTILIGLPVAFGMGLASASWLLFFQGMEPTVLARRIYFALSSFPLLAIPLFTMLGFLADRARMLPRLVVWLQMLLGRTRGGMAYVNVGASMLFAGISGTSVSDIASLGRVQIQLMTRAGYPVEYSAAITSATAIIGPIIPPSVAMIIYALAVGNVSVGGLFVGGAVPGLLFGLGFLVLAWWTTRRRGYGVLLERPRFSELVRQTVLVIPLLFLPVIIVGGIIFGVFTVTESAAIGVVYTVIVGFLSKPRLRLKDIYDAIIFSAVISSVAGMLLATGGIMSWLLTFNGVTQQLADFLISITTSPTVFMIIVMLALLVLGMMMDAVPLMIALAPLLAPVAQQYAIPDIQFGLLFVITCLIGLVTPPVGIVLFMTSSLSGVAVERLSWAIAPFVVWMIIVVLLVVLVPPLTTWLPAMLGF